MPKIEYLPSSSEILFVTKKNSVDEELLFPLLTIAIEPISKVLIRFLVSLGFLICLAFSSAKSSSVTGVRALTAPPEIAAWPVLPNALAPCTALKPTAILVGLSIFPSNLSVSKPSSPLSSPLSYFILWYWVFFEIFGESELYF